MNARTVVTCLGYSMLALTLAAASPRQAWGDDGAEHARGHQHDNKHDNKHDRWDKHDKGRGELVQIVRDSTRRFRDVLLAEAEGYQLQFGCVSGPDVDAMGLHYVNTALIGDGVLDAMRPEIVLYEPRPNGRVKLTGADYIVLADAWHANNTAPPQLKGQLFHLFESPNRFGLPDFYTLHVWAWKNNPLGQFTNWQARVSCESFDGQAD